MLQRHKISGTSSILLCNFIAKGLIPPWKPLFMKISVFQQDYLRGFHHITKHFTYMLAPHLNLFNQVDINLKVILYLNHLWKDNSVMYTRHVVCMKDGHWGWPEWLFVDSYLLPVVRVKPVLDGCYKVNVTRIFKAKRFQHLFNT